MRKEKASSSAIADRDPVPVSEMEEIEEDLDDFDDDFVVTAKKAKKPDAVPLLVPRNITQPVALNSKRWKMSDVATSSTLALVIKEAGGDLDDFALSTSTKSTLLVLILTKKGLLL